MGSDGTVATTQQNASAMGSASDGTAVATQQGASTFATMSDGNAEEDSAVSSRSIHSTTKMTPPVTPSADGMTQM
jgi:hypothetical protein